jgi:hypothetical protein
VSAAEVVGEEKGIFEEVVIALTIVGGFSEVRQAIALIETLPHPVKITQARLEARLDGKKTVWSVPLSLSVLKKK